MSSQVSNRNCPVCGVELPANAPQGLCPKCLLLGVAAPTEPGASAGHRPAPPALEAVGGAFPQLEVIELIGQGGMGAVFKARQPKLNRFVALKILPEALSRDPAFAERFAREGQMLARLHHPNIVTIHDFGQANGFFYLLMEYVEGVNLRQAMQAGRFTPEQALAIVPMICEALQYAHDEGVLHRDIKPPNILLDTKGRVRLVDFGIAKLAASDPALDLPGGATPADATLTQSGTALGTPNYMAPEQRLDPSTVDQRADIYSLGVVFYEMLTGELPSGSFPPPSRKTPLDPRVDDVVLRALARQKEQRFRSANEIKTSVEAITSSPATRNLAGAAIPQAAEGHPIALSPRLRNLLVIELVVLLGLTVNQFFSSIPFLLRQLAYIAQAGWVQALVSLAGLAGVGWLALAVWRRRHWLIAPFQIRGIPSPAAAAGSGVASGWSGDDWMSLAWLGLLGSVTLEIAAAYLSQVELLAQAAANLQFGGFLSVLVPTGATLLPAVLAILLVVLLVRRELRRKNVCAPSAPPLWMPRFAVLWLGYVVFISLPLPRLAHGIAITNGSLLALPALALVTRSRLWRAIGLAVMVEIFLVGMSGLIFFSIWALRGGLPPEWSDPVGPVSAAGLGVVVQLANILCYLAGFAALLLPSATAAFGIRTGPGEPNAPASSASPS